MKQRKAELDIDRIGSQKHQLTAAEEASLAAHFKALKLEYKKDKDLEILAATADSNK